MALPVLHCDWDKQGGFLLSRWLWWSSGRYLGLWFLCSPLHTSEQLPAAVATYFLFLQQNLPCPSGWYWNSSHHPVTTPYWSLQWFPNFYVKVGKPLSYGLTHESSHSYFLSCSQDQPIDGVNDVAFVKQQIVGSTKHTCFPAETISASFHFLSTRTVQVAQDTVIISPFTLLLCGVSLNWQKVWQRWPLFQFCTFWIVWRGHLTKEWHQGVGGLIATFCALVSAVVATPVLGVAEVGTGSCGVQLS